ncbi:P-loop NTPase fold protein [Clostridium perfringens]|uniref:P-loop NTPase fold protein n=1 Tax=Clostridium perfringens TaxID=1502 RepID=UPI0037549F7E
MEKIKKQINYYLNDKSANYALLINGDWGCGKTFLWKNIITKFLEENKKNCIYVSLNGVSSKEEIDKAIFFEYANNKLKLKNKSPIRKLKKVSKPIVSLGKTIVKVTGKFDNINFEYDEFTNLSDFVLCFDDLERVDMPIEKILGYINNFVEHEGIKTFIIANEQEIANKNLSDSIEAKYQVALELIKFEKESCNKQNEKDKNNASIQQIINKRIEELFKDNSYNRIKEKLIGRTIKYNPDLNQIIKNLISNFDGEYNKLLTNNLYQILKNNYNKNVNIRILIQTLNEFESIYKIIKKIMSNIKDKEVNIEEINEEELVTELLKFYVLISIELRLGNISSEYLKEVYTDSYNNVSASVVLYPKIIHGFGTFIEKYYEKECFYIREMVNLILEGYLDEVSLKEDIKKFIKYKYPKKDNKRKLTPYQKLENFRELDDKDVKKNVELLKDELKKDENIKVVLKKVSLIEYLYGEKAINVNLKDLKSEIEQLINDKEKLEFFDVIESMPVKEDNTLYYEIYLLAKERYQELISKTLKIKLDINKNLHEITDEIKEYCNKNRYKPIFIHINSSDLASKVINSNNNEINEFIYLIKSIYMSFSNIEDYYSDDIESLKVLYENISKNIKQDEYSVKNSNLMLLASNLEKICERLDKHNKKS